MSQVRADALAIVIPTRERWDVLTRTLEALGAQSSTGFEVVIVCDGRDQAIPQAIHRWPDVRLEVQDRAGPAAARNHGTRLTARPIVMFLGDDMLPAVDLVERHLERHQAQPEPEVAVLGRVRWHPEVARGRVMRWLEWSDAQFDFRGLEQAGTANAGFGRFYASNVSLKRELFMAAGGFDPSFDTADYEDLDLGWRLHQLGLRLLYEPRALTYHLHRHDLSSLEQRYLRRGAAERRMAAKHEWFTPWFHDRLSWHASEAPVARVWPLIVDLVPPALRPLRSRVEQKADRWYHQRLAPWFRLGWEGEREAEELRVYLGDRYEPSKLYDWLNVVDQEFAGQPDEDRLYRTSQMYLYSLTGFAMTPTKGPYRDLVRRLAPPGARILDYGCGIGSDGLRLLEEGYRVSFAEFDNPSARYLRWRLAHRQLHAEVYDLEGAVPGGFDLAFAFDVIEHVEDPFGLIAELERRARLVVVNLLEPAPDETPLHRELPIGEILAHARRRGLRCHEVHGRSHVVAFLGVPQPDEPAGVQAPTQRASRPVGP
jgi:GT2 family glycosyltransferase/SAM-dependent methyltransferase